MDIENEIIEEIVEQVPAEEVSDAPQTLREQIESAAKQVKEPQEKPEKEEKPKPQEGRDEKGKFAKKTPDIVPIVVEKAIDPEVPLPKSYGKAVVDAWKDLPREIKAELSKREQDFHRELTKHDEERTTGRQFKDIVNPYMAQIRAEGGDPLYAVQNFFNMAHILRTGTPQQKAKLLIDTATQFGVDINQAQQGQPRVDPVTAQIIQRQEMLERQLQNQQLNVKQQKEKELVDLVGTFISDTVNYPHFTAVEAEMMALLNGGLFPDETPADRLKKVYDYAVHANPQTRSSLISNAEKQAQDKRVADKKAQAEAARKAGSSLKGKPGMGSAPIVAAGGSLRDQLRTGMREAREA